MSPCNQCGASTVWDDDASSAICTICGTLVDSSQSVLSSIPDYQAASSSWNPSFLPKSTLKSLRNPNWQLAGQGKEARDRQNSPCTEFINSLANILSVPTLSSRATTLFTQAMAAGNFRWGRKAKLVAGACLSIALRESKRPDFLRDIAFLLDQHYAHLTRVLSSILSLLNVSLTSSDPFFHVSNLQSHLSSVIQDQVEAINLPPSLVTVIRPLSQTSVTNTCRSLSDLLARMSPSDPAPATQIHGTACAIFMLALEAEARATLPSLGELGACLAARCSVGKGLVMNRYKAIQGDIVTMMEGIQWLDQYQKKNNGRAKVSKRLLVARGLPDVLSWQDEIWRKKIEEQGRPIVDLDCDCDEDVDLNDHEIDQANFACSHPTSASTHELNIRPRKKQKTRHALSEASQFLLDPLSGSLPLSALSVKSSVTEHAHGNLHRNNEPQDLHTYLPLTSYLLAAPLTALQSSKKPTRLQLLSVARGGASTSDVDDDELFEDGELEGLMRTEEEIQDLIEIWEREKLMEVESDQERRAHKTKNKAKIRYKGGKENNENDHESFVGSKKVNTDALARFMADDYDDMRDDDSEDVVNVLGLGFSDDEDEDEDGQDNSMNGIMMQHAYSTLGHERKPSPDTGQQPQDDNEVVVLRGWRPPSPDGSSLHESRYDQEYD
ncbi:uncharacterized protein EV420DRAFT_1641793 [Desarmillaria tabescens]|uniref:TFIIB-type domain-containing protein n=1 Tax=Armillaria tabescens TaxID=1929756 RepID=A0AA39N6W2_ARMTA|nr:uncharacterized protein EV420DRAFT_1641793 [Desarmillaria tabescens]KAK0459588.1 hypothetical protein EV420DRAFT_1641793 [Desarmillaria tabescens]